jgi:orotidine-5'-phosphate decarboxylase
MNYTEKLKSIVSANKSNLVIGLDSDLSKLPEIFLHYNHPVSEFNKIIIEVTKDIAAGYKLNAAFYECLGEEGIKAVRDSMNVIPENMIRICDAKRGDIDNSAEMYARTYFDVYGFDSITLSPYMGEDSVRPFLERKNKLVYMLALTSNKGHSDFQKLKCGDKYLYETVIEKSLEWSKDNNTGFVFGANHTQEIKKFTSENPGVSLLIPGIGAQSNDLNELMKCLNSPESYVINSSRGIIYPAKKDCTEKEFADAVRASAVKLNNEINSLKKISDAE